MKHKLIFLILFFALSMDGIYSQQSFCGTDLISKKLQESNPELIQNENEYENFIREYSKSQEKAGNGTTGTVYIIPVVFHILHQNGIENISNAQVCDAIALLNEDFRKRNADTIYTINQYTSIAADAEIEFRLATKDPNGNITSGIDRIYTSRTYNANDSSKLNQWSPSQYLNIWVVDSLEVINGIYGVKGYAYGPQSIVSYPQYDGVLMRHDCIGRFGSGGIYQATWARILTHEVGHYLNLLHTWGNNFGVGTSCTGDDFVADTPPTAGSLWCSNLYLSTCGYLDNVQNYMNYSYCYTMFTQGQVLRMRACMNSPIAGRSNLWTPANLILTGTDNNLPCASSGVNESGQSSAYLSIFPNPTPGKFTIEYQNKHQKMSLEIYNLIGMKIFQQQNANPIDLSNSPKVIYFVKIYDGTEVYSKKVIIQ